MKENYKAISLFSGAGGLDIGLEQAGIEIVLSQDVNPVCVQTASMNGRRAIAGDIREIDSDDIIIESGLQPGEPFLICGGPPCQPFSTAGKRLGVNDPRGSLFMDFVRIIKAMQPRFFIMENVKGLLSAHLKDEDGKDLNPLVFWVILDEFEKLGYKIVDGVLDAVNYGAPQFRERLIIIGSRDNEDLFMPIPTHFQTHQKAENRWATLGSAIWDLEKTESECDRFTESRLKYLRLVPEGGNWKDLPKELQSEAMGGAFESGGGKVGFYRRLSYAQPSPTLTTSPVQKATMMCHPVLDRPLSVAEYARIQQFPDDMKFAGTMAEKYRQIGNAVPVGLGRALGDMLVSIADGKASVSVKRFRGTGIHNKIQAALTLNQD